MIEMGKKYQTRDGRAVRILCVDGPRKLCVLGVIAGREEVDAWNVEGRYSPWLTADVDNDLVLAPAKHQGWMVTSDIARKACFTSYAEAREFALMRGDIVAHVTWEET